MFSFKRVFGVAAFSLAIALGADAGLAASKQTPIWISGDRGGHVIRYAIKVAKAKRSGQKVAIAGRCASACTLYLSMPRAKMCVSKGAQFAFHMPYGASSRNNRVAASYMMGRYPSWVRSWIHRNGGLSSRMITMNYAYASKFLPTCTARSVGSRSLFAKL